MSQPATQTARLELRIFGRVQGVAFRASAAAAARRLGLTGWVRNCPDLTVEAVAEGPRPALDRFLDWCNEGPPSARVDDVRVQWGEATGEHEGFVIRR